MRIVTSLTIMFSTALGACTAVLETPIFADPGKYEFFDCRQLATEREIKARREQELKLLTDKAEQGTGGAFVNAIAYKTEYVEVQEELKLIAKTERVKKCNTPENWQSNSA